MPAQPQNETRSGWSRRLIGVSAWAARIRNDVQFVSQRASSVVITGPSGTGKELIARAIHDASPRCDKPFIPVNCAAISSSLFASHMFGHVKGSFTGAHYDAVGCFRAANGGTVFLDEVGEMEIDIQAKLLRVLQEKVVVPVGAHEGIPIEVRVVVATNRDLEKEVAAGRFREDLYYRLNVVTLRTAPLKDRTDDIPSLSEHFLAELADRDGLPVQRLSSEAVDLMRQYTWPGNVRQLRNVLERSVVYATGPTIDAELMRDSIWAASDPTQTSETDCRQAPRIEPERNRFAVPRSLPSRSEPSVPSTDVSAAVEQETERHAWLTLAELEERHIRKALDRTYFNQTAAAELLGVSFRVLARKIKNYRIDTSLSRRGRPHKTRVGPASRPDVN